MKEYYKQIKGFFTFADIYTEAINLAPNGSTLIEIGSLFGKSLAFLVEQAEISKKNLKIFSIDPWDEHYIKGTKRFQCPGDPYFYFLTNMAQCGFLSRIIPLRLPSVQASTLFEDKSCFFVFIDGNHEYEFVKKDICCWLPKIQQGGILAGHDYHENFKGVIKAVDEIFGKDKITTKDSWIKHL